MKNPSSIFLQTLLSEKEDWENDFKPSFPLQLMLQDGIFWDEVKKSKYIALLSTAFLLKHKFESLHYSEEI